MAARFAKLLLLGLGAVTVGGALGATSLSCGPADFDPSSKVTSIRVLATKVSHPYAAPGESVTIDLLAFDGRKSKPRPMKTYWLPFVCINPIGDAYYACFAQLAGASFDGGVPPVIVLPGQSDAGAGDGGTPSVPTNIGDILKPGTDITPFLQQGPSFTFTMPTDIVSTHVNVPGADTQYGLAIAFNITCAGQVKIVDRSTSNNPQAVPIGCFDDSGAPLTADDYVFGFTRVYGYDKLRNENPVISDLTYDGAPIDLTTGITVDHCATDKEADCPKHKIDVVVPDSSQEDRPGEDSEGRKERLWATYYATDGKFDSELRILFDSNLGRVSDSANDWAAPKTVGPQRMWVVVRDSRAGAEWREIPVTVK